MKKTPGKSELHAWELVKSGLGPLLPFFDDPSCNEIMVNPDGSIWVERHGQGMRLVDLEMTKASIKLVIEVVASFCGEICDRDHPEIGGIMPVVGARFQGVLPPVVPAPMFSIRLPSRVIYELTDYIDSGILTLAQATALAKSISARKNILIAGGTGSGKTTFANALLALLEESDHRIITIEDTPELRCLAPNTVPIHISRQSGFDYAQALFIALRMRPDRIVVGELRDGLAALNVLKAWNTGHSGGFATLHANDALGALSRLEQLLKEEVAAVPRELVCQAVDIIVFIERYTRDDGTSHRRVRDVAFVSGRLDERGDYLLEHMLHPSVERDA